MIQSGFSDGRGRADFSSNMEGSAKGEVWGAIPQQRRDIQGSSPEKTFDFISVTKHDIRLFLGGYLILYSKINAYFLGSRGRSLWIRQCNEHYLR